MLSFAAVAVALAAFWWLCLRVLDACSITPAVTSTRWGDARELVRQWGGSDFDRATLRALDDGDPVALQTEYAKLNAPPPVPTELVCGRMFAEALVSLALAEASGDIAKAHRGLEAVRWLRAGPVSASQQQRRLVLDLIEARVRLVLADAGDDPLQRQLAMSALDRAESGR